ncbi:related to Type I protein geranylgeranyltransferase beta subunit [Ustilago trichophora]|uniref:Geranylgeranyl transferase type-1 subunit beta n=1 Tax=Ustilago trichophora TaxID=86804 RepID=A0A5C3EK57_9BASI|nr:related to Type I protein geranylgeranyltransferase beta subunit [Ustilago trichophora]
MATTQESVAGLSSSLDVKKHISFLLRCLRLLPQPYTSADDQRMTLGMFAISGLDLLNATHKIPPEEKTDLIEWVYEQQSPEGGFRGSPATPSSSSSSSTARGGGNLAMTYAALLILAVLEDDFSRLDRKALSHFIGSLQDEQEGGFAAQLPQPHEQKELVDRDPRFTYCAIAICSMLGEWDGIDVEKAKGYLEGCQRYDGGFGASEAHESHSGMTYCCVAGLHLLPPASQPKWDRRQEALSWLAHRQVAPSVSQSRDPAQEETKRNTETNDNGSEDSDEDEEPELTGGFQGRPSKLPPDVCYSFWNGAALALLWQHGVIDSQADAGYVLSAQSRVGGIAKIPGDHPDLLHTYLGLASLALHQPGSAETEEGRQEQEEEEEGEGIEFGMKRLDAAWNCSLDAKAWIKAKLSK